ncbi:hypothetical protein DSECCO2_127290 [anaerobic digester metagenome]
MKNLICTLFFTILSIMSFSQGKEIITSPYFFPDFSEGLIKMKHGGGYSGLLNYNIISEELVFEREGARYVFLNDSISRVDSVYIAGRKFVVHKNKLIELIARDETYELFVEHKCRVSSRGVPTAYGATSITSSVSSISSVQTGGATYELTVPDDMNIEPFKIYWIKKNDNMIRFTNIKQIIKYYGGNRSDVKAFIKENDISFEDMDRIILLFDFINRLNNSRIDVY